MKPILSIAMLALSLAGCAHRSAPLSEIPDELLNCQGAPRWKKGGTQRDAADHVVDLRADHADCSGKLGEVRALARPGS